MLPETKPTYRMTNCTAWSATFTAVRCWALLRMFPTAFFPSSPNLRTEPPLKTLRMPSSPRRTAIAGYLDSLPDTDGDGIGNVPASYKNAQNRKEVLDSKNIVDLVKNPNKYAVIIVLIVIVILVLVFLLFFLPIRAILRYRKRKKAAVASQKVITAESQKSNAAELQKEAGTK